MKDASANLEHIERVLRNGRQLLRLINNVLELSRYDAGQIKLQLVPIDVRELINNVCEMLEPLAAEKNLKIVVDCDRSQRINYRFSSISNRLSQILLVMQFVIQSRGLLL
nr:hypothetical protein [Nostoc sp. 'Peltigera malacea cyanobiont' DB3992]